MLRFETRIQIVDELVECLPWSQIIFVARWGAGTLHRLECSECAQAATTDIDTVSRCLV